MADTPDGDRTAGTGDTERGRTSGWSGLPPGARTVAAWSAVLLLVSGGLFVIGVVAVQLTPLTLALAATLLLAALLEPVADGLRRLRVPDSLSALGAVIVLLTAVVAPAWLIWKVAVDEFSDLTTRLGEGVDRLRELLASGDSPISRQLLDRLSEQAGSLLTANASVFVSGARGVIEVVGAILLVIVLLFFFLKDGRRMSTWTLHRVPRRRRGDVGRAADAAWLTLTRYVHGTIIIAAIDAVGIGLALVILRVPLALPLALIVFIGSFVPIIGATVTGSLAVLVALAANGPLTALLVLAAVIVVQQAEGNLLEPLIMKRQVRLHPVVILVVVTAGALAWGVAGAFLAVPLAAVTYRVAETLSTRT
jgi:predicted PurR-regulated permease PerM